jgi:hypothetical protein
MGSETYKKAKVHHDLVDFDRLPPQEQDKDRQQVLDTVRVLGRAGYTIVPVRDWPCP